MYTVVGSVKTRSARVLWLLEELGQPYTSLPAGPQSDLAFAHNPAGKVPVLIDGDSDLSGRQTRRLHRPCGQSGPRASGQHDAIPAG